MFTLKMTCDEVGSVTVQVPLDKEGKRLPLATQIQADTKFEPVVVHTARLSVSPDQNDHSGIVFVPHPGGSFKLTRMDGQPFVMGKVYTVPISEGE